MKTAKGNVDDDNDNDDDDDDDDMEIMKTAIYRDTMGRPILHGGWMGFQDIIFFEKPSVVVLFFFWSGSQKNVTECNTSIIKLLSG